MLAPPQPQPPAPPHIQKYYLPQALQTRLPVRIEERSGGAALGRGGWQEREGGRHSRPVSASLSPCCMLVMGPQQDIGLGPPYGGREPSADPQGWALVSPILATVGGGRKEENTVDSL